MMSLAARAGKALVCVHAENHGIITWMVKRLIEKGYTAPKYHPVSHARLSESEAFTRLTAFSEQVARSLANLETLYAEDLRKQDEERREQIADAWPRGELSF